MRNVSVAGLVGLALLVSLTGCGGHAGSAFVVNRPDWDYAQYDRLAILPGQAADDRAQHDAEVLSDRLTTLLTNNGTFTVLSRGELAEVFKEQDLSRLADAVDEGTALPEGQVQVAQAVVVTRVTDYELIAEKKRRTVPKIAFDRKGRPRKVGEQVFWEYRHGAEVEGSVRIVDAATGKILLSQTARRVPPAKTNRDRPPSDSPEDVAAVAVRDLATEFYKRIAPTRVEVEFDKDNLLVATDYFDGRYDEVKKLARSLGQFLVVACDLHTACDGNVFRIAIAEEEGRQNLFESEDFVWSGSAGPRGQSFQVPLSALTASGGEKFVAKLYSVGNPEPVVERTFQLTE